jgi:hypothetical protein
MDPEQMKKMMEDFRKQAETRLKESLGATDDEWKVLQLKIEKVTNLSSQLRAGTGMRGVVVMGAWGAGPGPDQQSDLAKKAEALRNILKNKDAKIEDIQAALKDYREAKAKVKEDLEKAQKELKEILTVKQEAVLVSAGMLE